MKALHADKTQLYTGLVDRGEIPLRAGVKRVIDDARAAGLRLAIATTTSPSNIDALLTTNIGPDWTSVFEVVEDSATAPRRKPDPQVYEQALARLGLTARECLAFEDSITGLTAARAVGIPTLVTPSHYTHHQDFRGAMRVVPDLAEVRIDQLRDWHAAATA